VALWLPVSFKKEHMQSTIRDPKTIALVAHDSKKAELIDWAYYNRTMIAERKLDIIIFFWDPMSIQPHDSDVKALIRMAVTWNIILACNRTTADFILTSPLMNEDYQVAEPDFSEYLNRKLNA
jgi:methylglyoxal synthase